MTRRLSGIVLLSVWMLLTAAAAPAAEGVLKLVPDSALGCVVINRPGTFDAKLQELGRHMELPMPSLLGMVKERTGLREGVDEQGTVALVFLPQKSANKAPIPVLLLPVTDYGKFLGQFHPEGAAEGTTKIELVGTSAWVRHVGGYAALTDEEHRDVLENTLKVSETVPANIETWRNWLSGKDLAVVVLPSGTQQVLTKIQQGILILKLMASMPGPEGPAAKNAEQRKKLNDVFDAYAEIVRAAQQEVTAFGIGLQLDENHAFRLSKRALLVADGKWANFVKDVPPTKNNLLAGLPDEPYILAGGSVLSEAMYKGLIRFSFNMMKSMPEMYGLDKERLDKLSELSDRYFKGTEAISMVMGVPQSGQTIYSGMVAQFRVDDSRAFLENYEKYVGQYNEVLKGAKKSLMPAMKLEKAEIDGQPALKITMNVPEVPESMQNPMSSKMMKAMLGPEGKIVAWLAPADPHTVVFGYENQDLLKQTMAAVKEGKSGLAGNAELQKTAALLPPNAFAVGYLNPAGTMDFVKRILSAVLPPERSEKLKKIPEFPKTPPIGLAISTAPNELESCLVVPAEVLGAIGRYVGEVKAKRHEAPESDE
jgi:hypothetical protein